MSKKISIKNICFILYVIIFISCTEDIKEINLNQIKKGSLKNDEYDFYKIVLPNEIDKDGQLVFQLDPNPTLDAINNIVSDPNLYISIEDMYPTNLNHKWSSNRFGDETISISGVYLNPAQLFYIGIYCKQKCNYILEITLIKNIILQENKINYYTIEKDSVMKFSFTTRNKFKLMNLNIVGSFLSSFYVYLSKNDPSSSNTLLPEPILFNGYAFFINNNNSGNGNTNEKYNLVVDNRDVEQDISIWLKYDNDKIKIKEAQILYDAISKNKANCYYYSINKINQNKDIILSTTLFNGLGFIYISGFNSIDAGNINKNFKNKDNSYKIIQNKVIHLTKSDFQKYGKYNDGDAETPLNFCFYAENNSSLSIKIHLLENFKNIQTLNYIYPGIKLEDILPSKSLTRYQMEHFNIENDINIFLTQKSGNSKLYLYMMSPDRANDLLDYDNFEPFKKADIVLEAQEYFNGFHLVLTKQLNKCKMGKYSCHLNAIVECNSNEECTYELFFDHSKFNVLMNSKQIYKNVISENEDDSFTIIIADPSVKNFVVVLTPITGKIILKLESYIDKDGNIFPNDDRIIGKDLMPGLIKFSHEELNMENLMGNFYFTVKGLSYASYSIYYYTFEEDENEEYLDQDKVSMKLETGNIIKDLFMDNHKFKVYMYDSFKNANKSDLIITLIETDSINSELYIFKDLNDFSIIDDRIYGYLWKGEYKDFVYINKDEKKYLENDILYIMIYKKTKTLNNGYTTFYLGITDENTPFLLNEGIEFKHQLDTKHNSQKFFYYYINDEEDMQISLSLYIGKIDIIVKVNDNIYTIINAIEEGYLILIHKFKLDTLCKNKSKCPIYIEISNNKNSYYSSFLIAIKSTKDVPIYLKQGVVNKRSILSGEEQHFIVDIKPDKTFGAKISAFFIRGQGEIYARKVLKSELYNITNFPNEYNYEYISTYKLSQKNFYIIEIPYEEIANYDQCKILLTIRGVFPGYFSGTKIEYSLSISNTINEIVKDKNYRLFISQGEIVHYHFRVGPNKKRLYISMTNKDKDANMFLNYENYLSSISNYQWKNIGVYNEYLDISLDDSFFTKNQMQDIDGDYYLAIQGLNDCFFNLYISTEDVKIMTLANSIPAGCSCETENDFCYFRYENINNPISELVEEQNIIFYTEFTYGSGSLFGKLYSNGNMEEIIKSLPSSSNHDFIGNDLDEFLYVRLNRGLDKYTLSSVIVVGVQCKKKSLFDLSAALLDRNADITRNDQKFIFLKIDQDNIFYLSSLTGKINKFVYYISQEKDFNFQIKGLIGQAQIHAYTNGSLIYNKFLETDYENIITKDFHHIADFLIDTSQEGSKSYYGNVPIEYGKRNYLFIDIKPIEECLIKVNIHYDIDMEYIPLNKEVTINFNRYNFYAYFDFLKDIEDVIITVTTMNKAKKFKVYLRRNILEFGDDYDISNQTKYSIPNSLNYDIKGETNSLTSAIALRIQNGPKNIREKSIVRVLVNIESEKYSFNEKLKIIVTPLINNINRIRPKENIYYFSNSGNKNKDKTLFMLKNLNKENDIMIIEISLCKGDFLYALLDTPPGDTESYSQLKQKSIKSNIYSSNGKKIIMVRNLEVKEYYLMIYGKKGLKISLEKDTESDGLELLFLYYTTNAKKYNYLVTKDSLDYESKDDFHSISFILPELKKRDILGREKYVDYMNYTCVVSEKKIDFNYMESTCYLTKLIQRKEKNNEYSYLKTNYDSKNHILSVKGFLSGKTYYMNILAENEYTGEVITFKPIMIVTSMTVRKLKIFIIIFLTVILLLLFICAFKIYRKYRIQKAQIENFEINNETDNIFQKNIGNLKNIKLNFIKKKYNSLSEDNKEINT